MTIAFISYWGINDGLSQSTTLPNVKMLASFSNVDQVILFTIERTEFSKPDLDYKIIHVPLVSKNFRNVYINKLSDFIRFTNIVAAVVKKEKINLIICRSSLAGGIGFRVHMKTGVPYVVESFEPHAEYMLESGVWSHFDPRYWIEKYFQHVQRKTSRFLLPVSNHYAHHLSNHGVIAERILVVPCVVDSSLFKRTIENGLRNSLGITNDAIVGVYVGKFGGLYYDNEAFEIFAQAKTVFQNFFMLVLTPDDSNEVEKKMRKVGFSLKEFRVMKVSYNQVPAYLSVADFAFATYKPSRSKKFLSPIKVGEYWACGLPVLLTRGIGDDADIIHRENLGATFIDTMSANVGLREIATQLHDPQVRKKCVVLADKHRSKEILNKAYLTVVSVVSNENFRTQ